MLAILSQIALNCEQLDEKNLTNKIMSKAIMAESYTINIYDE